jgi:hypothetical protein
LLKATLRADSNPSAHALDLLINGRTSSAASVFIPPERRLMTIQHPPDPTAADMAKHLPHAITRYLREADPQHKANAHDLLAAFAPDATVIDDDGNTYTGHDEIHRWRETEDTEYTYTVEVSHVEKFDDTHYVVTNHLEGDFPGGVVDVIYRFTLVNGLITRLEIAP